MVIAPHTIPVVRMIHHRLMTLTVLWVLCASHVTAPARQDDVVANEPGVTRIQRADLLRAFVRFERRWAQTDPTPAQLRRFTSCVAGR